MIYISNLVSRRCRTSSRFAAALISSSVLLFGASLALSWLRLQQEEQRYSTTGDRQPGGHGNAAVCRKFAEEVHDLQRRNADSGLRQLHTRRWPSRPARNVRGRRYPICRAKHRPSGFHEGSRCFDLPCVFDSLDDCRKKLDDPDFTISSARCTPTAVTTCSAWQIKDSASCEQ